MSIAVLVVALLEAFQDDATDGDEVWRYDGDTTQGGDNVERDGGANINAGE